MAKSEALENGVEATDEVATDNSAVETAQTQESSTQVEAKGPQRIAKYYQDQPFFKENVKLPNGKKYHVLVFKGNKGLFDISLLEQSINYGRQGGGVDTETTQLSSQLANTKAVGYSLVMPTRGRYQKLHSFFEEHFQRHVFGKGLHETLVIYASQFNESNWQVSYSDYVDVEYLSKKRGEQVYSDVIREIPFISLDSEEPFDASKAYLNDLTLVFLVDVETNEFTGLYGFPKKKPKQQQQMTFGNTSGDALKKLSFA